MGKAKGSPKTGGRQKGTPNKATQLKQQALQLNQQALMQLVEKYLMSSSFKKDFDELAPRERIDTVIKILAFVIPKPQAVAIDVNANKKNTIEEKLAELAEEI